MYKFIFTILLSLSLISCNSTTNLVNNQTVKSNINKINNYYSMSKISSKDINTYGKINSKNNKLTLSITYDINNKNKLNIKALDINEIKFAKIYISGISITSPILPSSFINKVDKYDSNIIHKVVPVNNGNINTTFNNVPSGKARVATIVAYGEENDGTIYEITGSTLKVAFDLIAGDISQEVSFKVSPTGEIIEKLLVEKPIIAVKLNLSQLQTFINTLTGVSGNYPNYSYTTHPSLINTDNIANDLIYYDGNLSALDSNNPDYKIPTYTVTLTLNGLQGTDTATIKVLDPSSNTLSNVSNGTFTVTGVKEGSWDLLILSPNYLPYRTSILVNNNITISNPINLIYRAKWNKSFNSVNLSSPVIKGGGDLYVNSTDNKLYSINLSSPYNINWSVVTNGNNTTPILSKNGDILVAGNKLYCLNPLDGAIKDEYNLTITSNMLLGPDNTVYFRSSNKLYAVYYNPLNSSFELKWQVDISVSSSIAAPVMGLDGTIYVPAGAKIYSVIDMDTFGIIREEITLDSEIINTPSVGNDGTIYVGTNTKLYALQPNLTPKWAYNVGDSILTSPILSKNGTIYFGSNNKKLYAILDLGSSASLKWTFLTDGAIKSTPLIDQNNTIYFGSDDSTFYAVSDRGTYAEKLWTFSAANEFTSSPSIGSDGTIYITGMDGKLYALSNDGAQLADSTWPKYGADLFCSNILNKFFIAFFAPGGGGYNTVFNIYGNKLTNFSKGYINNQEVGNWTTYNDNNISVSIGSPPSLLPQTGKIKIEPATGTPITSINSLIGFIGNKSSVDTSSNTQQYPSIAYDNNNNRYLITWFETSGGINYIYAKIIKQDGTPYTGVIGISTSNRSEYPAVAFNSNDNKYLITWTDYRSDTGGGDIYGQVVNVDGLLDGGNFVICSAGSPPTLQSNSKVSYSPDSNKWIVIWEDGRNGGNIYSRVVNPDKSLGDENQLSTSTISPGNTECNITYNSFSKEFLVTWTKFLSSTSNIVGCRIDKDGNLVGSEITIENSSGYNNSSAAVYNTTQKKYLVVWKNNSTDILGKYISNDGTPESQLIPICKSSYSKWNPVVAYCPTQDDYLIIWKESITSSNYIYAQRLKGYLPIGKKFIISKPNPNYGIEVGKLIYNPNLNEFFALWQEDVSSSLYNIFYQRIKWD